MGNQWCLFAWDLARKNTRTFVLGRLTRPILTKKRFAPSRKFDLNEELRGSLGVYQGKDDYEIVVELDAWAADSVRGRRLHWSQELQEIPGGMVRLRMRLNSLEEVERWVLSLGIHAMVIRPETLRTRIRKATNQIAEKYQGSAV